MTISVQSEQQGKLPNLGLLALAASLAIYVLSQIDHYRPPVFFTGTVLVLGGAVLLLSGIRSQQQGRTYAAATLLPLGIFWLSLISYEIFPELGLGRHPNSITMFSYLSLWGLFMAILFLGSFRQSLTTQMLYGAMMFSFLALAMDHLRVDRVFLLLGCSTGVFASAVAFYIALAQSVNHFAAREILPLGHWYIAEDEVDRT